MIKILTIIFLSTFAHAHDCNTLLLDGAHLAVIRQVTRLNPGILQSDAPTPAVLYLSLKRESEKYSAREIPPELAVALSHSQAKHFAVNGLTLAEASIFYRNALRALTQRAAGLWRRHEVKSLVDRPLAPRLQKFAEHLLDTFFSPNGLHDDSLSSAEAAQYFTRRPWLTFNWESAIATVERQRHKSARELEIPRVFDWSEGHRIRIAMERDRRTGECCLSEPGCTLCPHNRARRRSRN